MADIETDKQLPPVSCMCLTYGRPKLLEEAVYSFLLQDYEGEKELVILNDCVKHYYVYDHPEIRIINHDQRFSSVGMKRNACVEYCRFEHLFPWDDDDICLPHRLSFSIKQLRSQHRDFFKPNSAYIWNTGNITDLFRDGVIHAQSCFTKSLFSSIGGYPDINFGEDREFEKRIPDVQRGSTNIEDQDNYYIYKWGGSGSYHLSGYGENADNVPGVLLNRIDHQVHSAIMEGDIPEGEIELVSQWRFNYLYQKEQFDAGTASVNNRVQHQTDQSMMKRS